MQHGEDVSRYLVSWTACACLIGCAPTEHACDGAPVVHDEVHGDRPLFRLVSACELFGEGATAAGVFRFDDIVGTIELDPDGREVPQIRVTSDTEAVFFGDVEDRFTFSFEGGCAGGGLLLRPLLSARSGERVVLVIADHTSPIETELQIFREVSPGRFSNGQLFVEGVELEELRAIAREVHESSTCPYDEGFGVEP